MRPALYRRRRRPKGVGLLTVVTDTFTRADSAVSLGNADTGQAWSALGVAVFGIASNQAKYFSGDAANNIYAVVDAGVSNCSVSCTLVIDATGAYVAFRCSDINNLFIIAPVGGAAGYQIYKRVAGVYSQVGTDANQPQANGDVVKVVLSGNNISLIVNSVLYISATDAFNNTATKYGIGLQAASTSTRWDNFSVTVP